MSQRKLQQEIDKLVKKVKEGLEVFDFYYEKFDEADNQAQKEKLESDLKREIKKLQKSRDQIKTWLSGNEVKDKKPLLEYRHLIENGMERFKVVEKNMKTKAFSKEGLNRQFVDPKEKDKLECTQFLEEMLDELHRQNEKYEAEIETLNTSKRGKRVDSAKQQQLEDLQEIIKRNHWHQEKMEQLLRLVENGERDPDGVNLIQDDIKYYIESNEEPDFIDDETIYDELNLDGEEVDAYGVVGDFPQSVEEKKEPSPKKEATPPALPSAQNTPIKKIAAKPPATASPIVPPGLMNLKISTAMPSPKVVKPDLKFSSVVSSAATTPKSASNVALAMLNRRDTATPVSAGATAGSSAAVSAGNDTGSPQVSRAGLSTSSSTPAPASAGYAPPQRQLLDPQLLSHPLFKDELPYWQQAYENITAKPALSEISAYLETSLLNCPDSLDAEKPKTYRPQMPHQTSYFYPQEPLPELNFKHIIARYELDTLFYIFYYHQGEYLQLLAAQELSRRAWFLHKATHTWYQKQQQQIPSMGLLNHQPRDTWRYFDYKNSWMARKRDDFVFVEAEFEHVF